MTRPVAWSVLLFLSALPAFAGPRDDVYAGSARCAGIADDRKGWLFRTSPGHNATVLTEQPMNQSAAWFMVRRRAVAAGIAAAIGNHTFRATGITNFLENGGTLEHAQDMVHMPARAPLDSMIGGKSGSRRRRWRGSGCRNAHRGNGLARRRVGPLQIV